jgi:hypothetical protein
MQREEREEREEREKERGERGRERERESDVACVITDEPLLVFAIQRHLCV